MANEKLTRLVESLHSKTRLGKLEWSEADLSYQRNVYQLNLAMNTIRISSGDGENFYTISLINDDGKIVETFTDEDIDSDFSDHHYFTLMKELYEMAARRALGADKVLDEILSELDDDI